VDDGGGGGGGLRNRGLGRSARERKERDERQEGSGRDSKRWKIRRTRKCYERPRWAKVYEASRG